MSNEFNLYWERMGLKARYQGYKYDGTEYERRHTVEIIPVSEEVVELAKHLQQDLTDAFDAVYDTIRKAEELGLTTYEACCQEYFDQPTPEERITYTETEEEWLDRCIELDKA